MIRVQIALTHEGLRLSLPDDELGSMGWEPDEENAIAFRDLPESFARSYLRLRLRDFFYERFCLSGLTQVEQPLLANDRVGGGLHTGLLEQFQRCNRGSGYFDPDWRVIGQEEDGALAVEKSGVVLHVVRSQHLPPDLRAIQIATDPAKARRLSIRLPCYRFEPGYYIAIGNCGPVTAAACDIYFAASVEAVPTLIEAITRTLNSELKVPFSLAAPYEPEAYQGPEAIALRVEKSAVEKIVPLLKQIRDQHTEAVLRHQSSLFSHSLYPGISISRMVEPNPPHGFISAELTGLELVADAITERWYEQAESSTISESHSHSLSDKNLLLSRIRAKLTPIVYS